MQMKCMLKYRYLTEAQERVHSFFLRNRTLFTYHCICTNSTGARERYHHSGVSNSSLSTSDEKNTHKRLNWYA